MASWLKRRIPYRWWRNVHASVFVFFLLTTVHAFAAGTDTGAVRWTGLVVASAVAFLALYRLLTGRRTEDSVTTATAAPVSAEPLVGREPPGARRVVVKELRPVADDVVLVELAAADGGQLTPWEPGAHIDVTLPSGRLRPYSLCGDPADREAYRIAVRHVADGRGGSAEVYALRAGQRITISSPRHRFPLVLADHYLFIAGGIGITPILSMVRAAAAAGRDWQLLYGGRSRTAMAFADELLALGGDRVRLVPEDASGLPDIAAALAGTAPGAAVYCCGPEALLTAVERAVSTDFPDRYLHLERFGTQPKTQAREFQVELRRSGSVLPVPADRTLLEVIRDAVPGIPYSCEQGSCGSCELRVLDGTPDHRDSVLTGTERERRDLIYPCVSRARSPRLVLDL